MADGLVSPAAPAPLPRPGRFRLTHHSTGDFIPASVGVLMYWYRYSGVRRYAGPAAPAVPVSSFLLLGSKQVLPMPWTQGSHMFPAAGLERPTSRGPDRVRSVA